jgi:hypothetical protein
MHSIQVAAAVLFGLWLAWFTVIHPYRVERSLARIEALAIRTDGIVWIAEDRIIAMDDQLQTLQDEIVMWHAENKSLAKMMLGKQAFRDTLEFLSGRRRP